MKENRGALQDLPINEMHNRSVFQQPKRNKKEDEVFFDEMQNGSMNHV